MAAITTIRSFELTDTPRAGAPAEVAQMVITVDGFAYGTVGADIHVLGGTGVPAYVLENYAPPVPSETGWLRELPSRMLDARREVVAFTGRESELDELRRWRDSEPRLAAHWTYGAGGQGKTRLAARFAAESASAGWKVVTATHGPGAVLPPPGSQDLRLDGVAGLLVLVDYADRWPLTHLKWLFGNTLLLQAGVRTRVLLTARTADTWPAVRGALDEAKAVTSSRPLEPLPHGPDAREHMFNAARDGFAARYGLADRTVVRPPTPLTGEEFGLTLAVHVAALVAVDAYVAERPVPTGIAALTVYLLDREQLHWATLFDTRTNRDDPGEPAYRTPPAVMNRTVFVAALTGATSRSAGSATLERIHPGTDVTHTLTDHAFCYPTDDPARPSTTDHASERVLEPLHPDRLAEDFLALTLPGHDEEYPAHDWALPAAAGVVDPTIAGQVPEAAARAVAFLSAATERWEHVGSTCLYPLLRRVPRAAFLGGGATLTLLVDVAPIDVLEAVETVFPDHADYDLDPGIAHVVRRLTEHRLIATSDPAARARLYAGLGYRYGQGGLHEHALAPTQQAATIRRRLAEADPAGHLPDLAVTLNNLALRLFTAGRREEALATSEEAVDLYRRLAEDDDTAHLPGLAMALNNLGLRLVDMGRREEALAASEEALGLYRRLAENDPSHYLPDVAMAVNNLGLRLFDMGRREDALGPSQEAVDLHRHLAGTNPAAYLPGLASSLNNLGLRLSDNGQRREAVAPSEEAVEIRRQLSKANTAYLPDLAASLNNLGNRLSDVGQREEALVPSQEAVEIRRRLVAANPAAHLPDLASSLNNLGVRLFDVGRHDEALAPSQEAVDHYRDLAKANPAAHRPELAGALSNLGTRLVQAGHLEEGLAVSAEAVDLCRDLAVDNPAAHRPRLALLLNNVAVRLAAVGRRHDALAAAEEALSIHRELAEGNPAAHLPSLALSLSQLSTQLFHVVPEDALAPRRESLAIYRRLTETNPGYRPALASSLNNLGHQLASLGHQDEALLVSDEAVAICRELAGANPSAHRASLSLYLTNLGDRLTESARNDEALAVSREAVEICRTLPLAVSDLARCLSLFARARIAANRELDEGLRAATEAIEIYQRQESRSSPQFADNLASALRSRDELRKRLAPNA